MATHVSAMGKPVDMASLRQRNQHVRAVGNMNVDAEGNTLDSNNQVIEDSTNRVNRVYNRTTQNPSASRRPAPQARSRATEQPPAAEAPQPAPQPEVAPPTAVISPQAPAPTPEPSFERNPLIRLPDEDDGEEDIGDLADYDAEEPVGKETPKKK
jgi:hypothetical protein